MRLWTCQPVAVWKTVERDGVFHCDSTLSIDGNDWPDSYDWLARQMRRRIGPPKGVRWPIWAWEKKPDLRTWIGRNRREPFVRLTLEIPDIDVLLFDYDDWHVVLWHACLSRTEAECREFERREKELGEEGVRAEREASWERIFDLDSVRDAWQGGGGRDTLRVQATFWELRREQVRRVERFAGQRASGTVNVRQ